MMNFTVALAWVIARLKEPSSYAGLAGLLAANHFANAGDIASAVTSIGIGIASLIAIILSEKK